MGSTVTVPAEDTPDHNDHPVDCKSRVGEGVSVTPECWCSSWVVLGSNEVDSTVTLPIEDVLDHRDHPRDCSPGAEVVSVSNEVAAEKEDVTWYVEAKSEGRDVSGGQCKIAGADVVCVPKWPVV